MTQPGEDASVVTALHFDEFGVAAELATWCAGELETDHEGLLPPTIWVPTRKGALPATLGHWIVRRAASDFYPCTPLEFAALHEPLA